MATMMVKLFFLGVRQLSKPVASVARQAAANSESFSGLMAFIGRGLHRLDQQTSRLVEGKSVRPQDHAVVRGSELVSEVVIYTVAGATVFYEYQLQQEDKRAKQREADAADEQKREENRWRVWHVL